MDQDRTKPNQPGYLYNNNKLGENMVNLGTKYLGLKLNNPLLAASSGLTGSLDKIKGLEQTGIGGIVLKSVFEEQINNEATNLLQQSHSAYPEAEDYIRNYLQNNTLTNHLKLIENAKKAVNIPIIASINCISSNQWTNFARHFQDAGADALELNIFYVPVDRQERPGTIEKLYLEVLQKVKNEVSIPISVKIGMYHSNIIWMVDKLKANGANGIVTFNRFYEPDINLDTLKISSSEVLSSPEEIRHTLRWVGLISSEVTDIDIAASTGIHNGEAVIKQLLAGAKVTQLCSTLYLNGNKVVPLILSELKKFMQKWNFKNIENFRGRLSYKKIKEPLLYERSQFMKYFSNKK